MQKHKRIYTPEQKTARNNARIRRLASMTPEEQLSYQDNESAKRQDRRKHQNTVEKENVNPNDEQNQSVLSLPLACQLSNEDCSLLKKFHEAVSALKFNFCPICKKSFPTIVLVHKTGLCNRCNREKLIRRFSAENDMDPGAQVEEMLIAQILLMLTVYKLQGGQLGYRGHVINFAQDIQELITKLPRNPSMIDTLIIRKPNHDFTSFQEFKVKRSNILIWLNYLKINNPFYSNIEIDYDILNTHPEDGSIFDRLCTVDNNNLITEDTVFSNYNQDCNVSNIREDYIKYSFIPNPISKETEEVATYTEINQLVNTNTAVPIDWPTIKDCPINEFEEVGYIIKAFPTLFPSGKADLHSTQ
ncbi:15389_t:CDS:2 [Cetraspora pellucida]|uniref:15389_t:CDS:1 n=1 Tax=Cetraspora pellucida TaxID=1433469 RepID=A0A9N9ANK3_9GLOM|nr:15389_t:CDS:2 [Cetraspora pellucida]